MIYALISDGAVNALLDVPADGPAIEALYHPDLVAACVPVSAELAGVMEPGWAWDGAAFAPPVPPAPPAPIVPDITARQLRLWIIAQGRALAEVDAAIDALPEGVREVASVEWKFSTTYERNHPLIEQLAPLFGLVTPEAIDAAFHAAAQL